MQVSAYERIIEPERTKIFQRYVGWPGAFGLLAVGSSVAMVAQGKNTLPSGVMIGLGLLVLVGAVVGGLLVAKSKYKKLKSDYDAKYQWQSKYWHELDDLLRKAKLTEGESLASMDWSKYFSLYRPKTNETIYWMAPAIMSTQRERVEAVGRIGVLGLLGLPFHTLGFASLEHVVEIKTTYDHAEGDGVLVATSDNLSFVSAGHGENWSMPWGQVASWQATINALLVQPSQGVPKAFVLKYAGSDVNSDTQLAQAAASIAHRKAT
tara:strand:+ start:1199 stop:1993 length:795 start_codon:yes stop_codon:yes gene_type:complete